MYSVKVYKSDDGSQKYVTFSFDTEERCNNAYDGIMEEVRHLVKYADETSFTLDVSVLEENELEEGLKQIFKI
jgi:hypothetical protein